MRIDARSPLEELVGDNRGIIRLKLGRIHCFTPYRKAYRMVRESIRGIDDRSGWNAIPRALRRGVAKCVADTLGEYRQEYRDVMA